MCNPNLCIHASHFSGLDLQQVVAVFHTATSEFISTGLLLQVGDDNANLALQLVDYDKHVEAAMKHVFGNAFICTNADSAKKVTYDRQV